MAERRQLVIFAAVLVATGAHAGQDEIETDRPSVSNSPRTVGFHHIQIETGLTIDRLHADRLLVEDFDTPMLIRVGITDSLEARFQTDGPTLRRHIDLPSVGMGWPETGGVGGAVPFTSTPQPGRWLLFPFTLDRDTTSGIPIPGTNGARLRLPRSIKQQAGYHHVELGLKWQMVEVGEDASAVPAMALLGHLEIPGGSRLHAQESFNPSIAGIARWNLPWSMHLLVMPGVRVQTDELYTRGPYGVLALQLDKVWFDRATTFVELAAEQFRINSARDDLVSVNAGLQYRLFDRAQLDTMVRVGSDNGEPWLGQLFGLSFKM